MTGTMNLKIGVTRMVMPQKHRTNTQIPTASQRKRVPPWTAFFVLQRKAAK